MKNALWQVAQRYTFHPYGRSGRDVRTLVASSIRAAISQIGFNGF